MHLRVFLARRTRVVRLPISGLKDVLKLSDCGRLGRQAADHPWSALRVVESCRKDCPTASVLLEAKAAALHPKRYQSSLSKLSTTDCLVKKPCGKKSAIAIYQRGRVRRGKEAQANGFWGLFGWPPFFFRQHNSTATPPFY